MDSVGAILKNAREEKKFSLDQVSADTHILPGYILALEENRFQDLPGEAYCAGFIGTLARYYRLDSRHLVCMFRGIPEKKSQDSDSKQVNPIIKTEKKNYVPLILVITVLVVLAASLLFIFTGKPGQKSAAASAAMEEPDTNVYVMTEVLFERSFKENDIVKVQLDDSSYDIVCRSVGNSVVLGYRKGNVTLAPSEELILDLDGDTKKDVKVSLRDANSETRTAVIRIDRAIEAPVPPPLPAVSIAPKPESIIKHDKGTIAVMTSPAKRNFAFEVEFSGPCNFRYQADNAKSVENYYKAGDHVHLDIADEVRVWLSNAGNAKILLGSAEIILGNKGDVTSEKIGWEETADKSYNLSIISMH